MAVSDDARRLGARTKRIKVVDYYTVPWDSVSAGTPAPVMIAIRDWSEDSETMFSWDLAGEIQGIPPASIRGHKAALERHILESFGGHLATYKKAHFVHWGLNNCRFGIPALSQRMAVYGLSPPQALQTRSFDLAAYLKDQFGEGYVADPRLPNLIKLNKINDFGLLDAGALRAAFSQGNFSIMKESLSRKLSCISRILHLVLMGELRTDQPSVDASLLRLPYSIRHKWFCCLRDAVVREKSGTLNSAVPVILGKRGGTHLVNGRPKKMTVPQFNVVTAVLAAGETGLSKDEMVEKSGHSDAINIFKRLKKDADWEKVIKTGDKPGGRYRIC